jgi:hypothetical protein
LNIETVCRQLPRQRKLLAVLLHGTLISRFRIMLCIYAYPHLNDDLIAASLRLPSSDRIELTAAANQALFSNSPTEINALPMPSVAFKHVLKYCTVKKETSILSR